jgi:nucleotide-binding universal stress UspA family protein
MIPILLKKGLYENMIEVTHHSIGMKLLKEIPMTVLPRRILLATDLDARSDLAQDRAVSFTKQYNCALIVLHVLEPTNRNRTVQRVRFLPSFNPDAGLIESTKLPVLEYLHDVADRTSVQIEKGDPLSALFRFFPVTSL